MLYFRHFWYVPNLRVSGSKLSTKILFAQYFYIINKRIHFLIVTNKKLTKTVAHRKKRAKKIMKKLIIIAAASFFTFTSCSKIELTPAPQSTTISSSSLNPGIVSANQRYTITNNETNWGVVEYRLIYTGQNNAIQSMVLNMGQSVTLCLSSNIINANFAYTIVVAGIC